MIAKNLKSCYNKVWGRAGKTREIFMGATAKSRHDHLC
nr:MAG TPA: hypothetical protein [Caudoviricetes sp.]